MKYWVLILILFGLCYCKSSGPVTATVLDSTTGLPVAGVSVECRVSESKLHPTRLDSRYLGTFSGESDENGYFKITFDRWQGKPYVVGGERSKELSLKKEGYYPRYTQAHYIKKEIIYMDPILHYLELERNSRPLWEYSKSSKKSQVSFLPTEEEGVFLRDITCRFTKIDKRCSDYFCLFDNVSKKWILLSKRGELIKTSKNGYYVHPNRDALGAVRKSQVISDDRIQDIIGNRNELFAPIYSDLISKRNSKTVRAFVVNSGLLKLTWKKFDLNINDDDIRNIKIHFIIPEFNNYTLIGKTKSAWHFYKYTYYRRYGGKKKKDRMKYLGSIGIENRIVSVGMDSLHIYTTLQNGQMKQFIRPHRDPRNEILSDRSEIKRFFNNTKNVVQGEIIDMLLDSQYIYVLTGGDKIYRFNIRGWPERLIRVSEEPNDGGWAKHYQSR